MLKRLDDDGPSMEESLRNNEELERREKSGDKKNEGGGSKSKRPPNSRKCINHIYLDSPTFDLLSKMATAEGLKMEEFCVMALRYLAENSDGVSKHQSFFRMEIMN